MLVVLTIVAAALAGCARSAPARFYTLSPTVTGIGEDHAGTGPVVLISGVRVASYLERSQIVTRLSETEVDIDEFSRWAEPLEDGIARALVENLSSLLPDMCVLQRQPAVQKPDLQVSVHVLALEVLSGREVVLRAQWSLTDGRRSLAERLCSVRLPLPNADIASAVAAQSKALATLSEEIAAAIRSASL